jgi:hypothetical protein
MDHWAAKYIGLPWASGARGPREMDCWGLLCCVNRDQFGIELPLHPVDANDHLAVARALGAHLDPKEWTRLTVPVDGCGVAMGVGKRFNHVGVWLAVDGGLILHSAHGRGVTAQSLLAVRNSGMSNTAFFLHHGAHRRDTQPV